MQPKRKPKWYDSEGQRGTRRAVLQQSNSYRSLISLILLLGLVLLLIQQFSDKKKVAQIGQAIGLFEKDEVSGAWDPDAHESFDGLSDMSQEHKNAFEALLLRADGATASREQSIWTYYLSRLTSEQQDLLFRFFLAPKSKVTKEEIDPLMAECSVALTEWFERKQEIDTMDNPTDPGNNDAEILRQMRDRIEEWRSNTEVTQSLDLGSPFRIALDKILLNRFLDNQNWMSKEQLVALRSWARVREVRNAIDEGWISAEQLPTIELSQLMGGENANYRGVPIRFLGTIASADERTGRLQSEEWNGVAYRVWWMKPSEISSQPVAVYVPIELEPSQYESNQKSELEIVGFFAKRKAYASQRGAEIAPVLFAANVRRGVGPPTTEPSLFSQWINSNHKALSWLPPTDYATPLRLIRSTLESMPKSIENQSVASPLPPRALSLLLVAQKHAPEMQTLTTADKDWKLIEQLKITKLRAWCNRLTVWDLNAITLDDANKDIIATLRREGLATVFELTVQSPSNEGDKQNTVYVNSIPEAWRSMIEGGKLELRQPIEIVGFQNSEAVEERSYLVGSQIAWKMQPEDVKYVTTLQPEVNATDRYLLSKGWDLSQKDLIQQLQSPAQPLSRQEEVGLFSLLRIAKEDSTTQRANASFVPMSIVQIVKSSLSASSKSKQRPSLQWTTCEARVVRVTRITIDSPVQQAVLGQDHYFQLDCFADIGNVTFEIPTDTESITYAGEYPITCVAMNLPNWLRSQPPTTNQNQTSNESSATVEENFDGNQDVFYPRLNGKISGWFYRFWSYRTQEMTQRLGAKHRQITPLIVMSDFQIAKGKDASISEGAVSTVAWIAGLVAVGAIWWAVRSYGKAKSRQPKKSIRFQVKKESDPHR
ncbi:MAG: hypothetical protein ACK5PB_22985 [Pirellula sp.]|jgi:hypothetical protein